MFLKESFREEFDFQLNQLRRITNHGPSIGRFIELLLINLLKKYLPSKIDFTSGFVKGINIESDSSRQIDIICYDRNNYPILLDIGEMKVVSSKSVKALIEVKATVSKKHIDFMLNQSCSKELNEIPIESKMFLLSTNSTISPENAFKTLKEFYIAKPKINKFISTIYSLDWDQIIVCKTTVNEPQVGKINDQELTFQQIDVNCVRLKLNEKNNIAIFVGMLILEIYDSETYESICNNLGQRLFFPLEEHKFSIYTSS